jgi:hypothetical protein
VDLAGLILKFDADYPGDGDIDVPARTWAKWVAAARAGQPKPYQLGIIACSASKADRPLPARELYTGELFKRSLAVAESRCGRVVVLSARHGVLDLDAVIAPYDFRLPTKKEPLARWAASVNASLPAATKVLCLAPRSYWGGLEGLRANLAEVWDTPLKGLGIGEQKRALKLMLQEAA